MAAAGDKGGNQLAHSWAKRPFPAHDFLRYANKCQIFGYSALAAWSRRGVMLHVGQDHSIHWAEFRPGCYFFRRPRIVT
jgi:hypothetical protein